MRHMIPEQTPQQATQALPWANAMSDSDLHMFLGDLANAALDYYRLELGTNPEREIPDREVLAGIEKVCADWRTPGQGYREDADTAEMGLLRARVAELEARPTPDSVLRDALACLGRLRAKYPSDSSEEWKRRHGNGVTDSITVVEALLAAIEAGDRR